MSQFEVGPGLTPRAARWQTDPMGGDEIPVEAIICAACGQSITACTCEDEPTPAPARP